MQGEHQQEPQADDADDDGNVHGVVDTCIERLTKQLHEIKYYQAASSPLPSSIGSQSQRELADKIHKTLPLFLQVFAEPCESTPCNQCDCAKQQQQQQCNCNARHTKQQPVPLDRLADVCPFAYSIARLFVNEVRQLASNKHAEDASLAIMQFLSPQSEPLSAQDASAQDVQQQPQRPTHNNGWNLLLSLNALARSQSAKIIKLLCDASLPSTLVKSLYLFFDLPSSSSSNSAPACATTSASASSPSDDLRATTRSSLAEVFSRTLVHLCTHQSAIDELIKKDDLRLMVGIASSQCIVENRPWRHIAHQALLTIARNIHENFIYLEQNLCVQIFVDNLYRHQSLALVTIEELIDMMRLLVDFLYNLDVNNRLASAHHKHSSDSLMRLMEQFKSSRFMDIVEELVFNIDDSIARLLKAAADAEQHEDKRSVDDYRRYADAIMRMLVVAAKISLSHELATQIYSLKPLAGSRFQMLEHFRMLRPSARDCILNYEPLRLFKLFWTRCRDAHITECVLDATISLFNDDKYNYFVFESQQLLVYYMSSDSSRLCYRIKHKLFKFLEFIMMETNYVICLELATIGSLMKQQQQQQTTRRHSRPHNSATTGPAATPATNDNDLMLSLGTLIACLRYNTKFCDIFREIGLLEVIDSLLIRCMHEMSDTSSKIVQHDSTTTTTTTQRSYYPQLYADSEESRVASLAKTKVELMLMLLEASQHLLAGPNQLNCAQFNESGAARQVFNCIARPEFARAFSSPAAGGGASGQHSALSRAASRGLSASADLDACTQSEMTSAHYGASRTHSSTPTRDEPRTPQSAGLSRRSGGGSRASLAHAKQHQQPHQQQQQHQQQQHSSGLPQVLKQTHKLAFAILRSLILSSAGDEHLSNLLGLLARTSDDLAAESHQRNLSRGLSEESTLDSLSNATEQQQQQQLEDNRNEDWAQMVSQDISIKLSILKTLTIVLRDSHRCRALFRKAGGFTYVVAALRSIEGALPLAEPPGATNKTCVRNARVSLRKIWRLIKSAMCTCVVAMRYEPTNVRVFADDTLSKFTDAIRRLGPFRASQCDISHATTTTTASNADYKLYKSIFLAPASRDLCTLAPEVVGPAEACCQLFRFLYDMAVDAVDATAEIEAELGRQEHYRRAVTSPRAHTKQSASLDCDALDDMTASASSNAQTTTVFKQRALRNAAPRRPPSLDLQTTTMTAARQQPALLTFPCVIVAMLDLVPSSPRADLIEFVVSIVLRALFRHERNQQLLCESGLMQRLLSLHEQAGQWQRALTQKGHFLHDACEFMCEALARHSMHIGELRAFLRLQQPLLCTHLDSIDLEASQQQQQQQQQLDKVALDRVEQLACMLQGPDEPRHAASGAVRLSNAAATTTHVEPAFVEFDMSRRADALACVFLPSIAPVNARTLRATPSSFINSTLDVHTSEKQGILGGVGAGERVFPSPSGLTYSAWLRIDKFPARCADPAHNIRLLTIYRGSASTGKEYSCLRIQLSALDRALIVSTRETLLFDNSDVAALGSSSAARSASTETAAPTTAAAAAATPHADSDSHMRLWAPELLAEAKWHHLAIVLERGQAKHASSHAHVYLDGARLHSQRLNYVSACIGASGSAGNSVHQAHGLNSPSHNLRHQTSVGGSSSSASSIASSSSGSDASNAAIATSAAAYVNAIVGAMPHVRMQLHSRWKMGPMHLVEEPLDASFVQLIHALGPKFIGNFQQPAKLAWLAKQLPPLAQQPNSVLCPTTTATADESSRQQTRGRSNNLRRVASSSTTTTTTTQATTAMQQQQNKFALAEDKVLMCVDARATSVMSLTRMRRIYTRFDCRQVSRVLGLAAHENSTPILLMHNTGLHLGGASRGIGAVCVGHSQSGVRCFVATPAHETLFHLGGQYVLLGLVAQAATAHSLAASLTAMLNALKHNVQMQTQLEYINGYQLLAMFLHKKRHLLDARSLDACEALVTGPRRIVHVSPHASGTGIAATRQHGRLGIEQTSALRELICESFDLWLAAGLIDQVLEFLHELIASSLSSQQQQQVDNSVSRGPNATLASNAVRAKNLKCLREMDLLPRLLRLLMTAQQSAGEQCNRRRIYLIKQTVFELLNKSPRQSDLLYFGQFVASLCAPNAQQDAFTSELRNTMLRSVFEMMTDNQQAEVNLAVQSELVRILGFDWFMLYVSDAERLGEQTTALGLMNLMVVLSNDKLASLFKQQQQQRDSVDFESTDTLNGGWLKESTFPSIDSKFNIQMLGVNVGVFLGLNTKRRAIKHELLHVPNFYLLTQYLTSERIARMPRAYLIMFMALMNRFDTSCRALDSTRLHDTTSSCFEQPQLLTLDALCDSLMGETRHKRLLTLADTQIKCPELVVCIVHMFKSVVWTTTTTTPTTNAEDMGGDNADEAFPVQITRFLMYLYNNSIEFKRFCRASDALMQALAETLMVPPSGEIMIELNRRKVSSHAIVRDIIEFATLITIDTLAETRIEGDLLAAAALAPFDRLTSGLRACPEAQLAYIDTLMAQLLLAIDSSTRAASSSTTMQQSKQASADLARMQALLVNAMHVAQAIVDKLWSSSTSELAHAASASRITRLVEQYLELAEQVYKHNELLPKRSPPHAFVMQRVLNRLVLLALARPVRHMSDRLCQLELLKRIYDARAIIVLNHMHTSHSDEFFVCLVYQLMRIMEQNTQQQSNDEDAEQQLSSLQTSEAGASTSLMLASMARKVWDAVYRSKKGVLSEALDVSLSLPAFTLDTSLDLLQLKPNIEVACARHWQNFVDVQRAIKPSAARDSARRTTSCSPGRADNAGDSHASDATSDAGARTPQSAPASSGAVHLLSGKLTRVVNAASFVSRVVGATANSVLNTAGVDSAAMPSSPMRSKSRADSAAAAAAAAAATVNQAARQDGDSALCNDFSNQLELFRAPAHLKHMCGEQLDEATRAHLSLVYECVRSELCQPAQHRRVLHRQLLDEWLDIEHEVLVRERAVWGPQSGSQLDKWALDMTEGPRRMRKKMINNTRQFYAHYPYQPELYNPSNKSFRYRPPTSHHSHPWHLKTQRLAGRLLSLSATTSSDDDDDNDDVEPDDISSNDDAPLSDADEAVVKIANSQQEDDVFADLNELKDAIKSISASAHLKSQPTITIDSPSPHFGSRIDDDEDDDAEQQRRAMMSPQPLPPTPSPSPSMGAPASLSLDWAANNNNATGDDGDTTSSFVDFSPEVEAAETSASENIDTLSVLRLLERNERISHMFRCCRVQGLDTFEGLVLIGREHFYLIDGFTLLKTREIKDIDSLPPDAHEPIIPINGSGCGSVSSATHSPTADASSAKKKRATASGGGGSKKDQQQRMQKKVCAKFSYDNIVEVHKRRYLLQPIALEIFSSDGRNVLIVFPRAIRNKVYSRLVSVATQMTSNAYESLAGQKSNVSIEGGSGLLSNLIGETSVTQRWVRGELSNFQYLMNLNTIAGRSYNDLMQYPIFPWILADYVSQELDLTKPSTFRDLSRPMGAQTPDRLDQFKRRYAEWDDLETPPYHYGTFYSSAMIVASYMIRMEPFTQHFLRLQGGHFDLADRMFHSIHDSWTSASKHNMADVKELIPEFFYLPEFLTNDNKFDLGLKQSGMRLDDVVLPPWAKGDTREFIRLHRCALESDYVSAHLHEWIDLIFGHKQQGQPAVDAINVFHHLFYEGNVDIYNTDIDPIKKNAVIGFINNFGQVPKQLFKKPHPARKISAAQSAPSMHAAAQRGDSVPFAPAILSQAASAVAAQATGAAHGLRHAASTASSGPSSSSSSSANQAQLLTHAPHLLRMTQTQFKELKGPVGQIVQLHDSGAASSLASVTSSSSSSAAAAAKNIVAVEQHKLLLPPDYTRYVAWGHADRSVRLGVQDNDRCLYVWEANETAPACEIMCCTVASSRCMITGNTEGSLCVWRIDKTKCLSPMQHLYGHTGPVTCLASSRAYSIVVSGSRDKTAIVWDLNRLTFMRQLGGAPDDARLTHQAPISAIAINDATGDIATCAHSSLYLWSINGQLLASIDTASVSLVCQQPLHTAAGSHKQLSMSMSNMSSMGAPDAALQAASSVPSAAHLLSVCFSQHNEWDSNELVVTGASDGSIAFWSVRFVSSACVLPDASSNTSSMDEQHDESSTISAATSQPIVIEKQEQQQRENGMQIKPRKRTDTIGSEWVRVSPSASSGTSANVTDLSSIVTTSAGSSLMNASLMTVGGGGGNEQRPSSAVSNGSKYEDAQGGGAGTPTAAACDEDERASSASLPFAIDQPSADLSCALQNDDDGDNAKARTSSLVDSFVVVASEPPIKSPRRKLINQKAHVDLRSTSVASPSPPPAQRQPQQQQQEVNKENAQNAQRWHRELYLRALLPPRRAQTMIAAGGKVQQQPAGPTTAITSLAISKDHKILYVGEASGRVTSWSTTGN